MNVNWFVVVGVEHEPKTEKYKYCRHIYFVYLDFNAKIRLFMLIAKLFWKIRDEVLLMVLLVQVFVPAVSWHFSLKSVVKL